MCVVLSAPLRGPHDCLQGEMAGAGSSVSPPAELNFDNIVGEVGVAMGQWGLRDRHRRARPVRRLTVALCLGAVSFAVVLSPEARELRRPEVVAWLGTPVPVADQGEAPVEADAALLGRAVLIGMSTGAPGAIPPVAGEAYRRAASIIGQAQPACHLGWPLLAGIGWVESAHGGASGSWLDGGGAMVTVMFGPASSGTDTDNGEVDESPTVDRGVGPLQFMPAVWSSYGVDSDGDGRRDPQNINDAALSLAVFLCAGGSDLAADDQLRHALARFNGVNDYADRVLEAADFYRTQPVADIATASVEPELILESSSSATPEVVTATPSPSATTPAATPSVRPSPKPTPGPTASSSPKPTTSPKPTPAPSSSPTTTTAPQPSATAPSATP